MSRERASAPHRSTETPCTNTAPNSSPNRVCCRLPSYQVEEEWPVFNQSCAESPMCAAQGWDSLVIGAWGIIDGNSSVTSTGVDDVWGRARAVPNFAFSNALAGGNGNSRTNLYYWLATRPRVKPR